MFLNSNVKKNVSNVHVVVNVKLPLVHAMEAYMRREGIAPLILNIGIRWGPVVDFTSGPLYRWEKTAVPIE